MISRTFVTRLERACWDFFRDHRGVEPEQCVIVLNRKHHADLEATAAIGDLRFDVRTSTWSWKGIPLRTDDTLSVRIVLETVLVP